MLGREQKNPHEEQEEKKEMIINNKGTHSNDVVKLHKTNHFFFFSHSLRASLEIVIDFYYFFHVRHSQCAVKTNLGLSTLRLKRDNQDDLKVAVDFFL